MSRMRGAAVYPVSLQDDKLVFLLGEEDSYADSYSEYRKVAAFGGRTNIGESLEDCASREAFEELNGLYYTIDEWKSEFKNKNCVGVVEYDDSKAYIVYVPYDKLITQHFNGTRALLHALRNHLKISRKDFTKTGYAEKHNVRWYTLEEIQKLRESDNMRFATKKTFNNMNLTLIEANLKLITK